MKRYRFSLEAALRARRAQEDVARQNLAAANHRLVAARRRASVASAVCREIEVAPAPVDKDTFLAARGYELRMAEAAELARQAVIDAEAIVAARYQAWVEAGKQVASLERLDERRREEWELEARRDEAATVDDVVASRWIPQAGVA